MIVILGALLGAIIGGTTAKRRKGNWADIAQYAAGFAIAFGLLGFLVTIAIEKSLG
ncbi:apolipoprotein acyltransferase [Antarctobacter heliothermus]|uniref:Apolipoprotein acyltransferase n=1 Tax=Antarctobacter heliothermus TaxID=74033 RepID=A0A222E6Q2_9RHOB|nr:apolipoprotein acyltransferase [Antarctobacter heliothermus]ASP21887.1 apolipoprotein acyltransferase [Antarctobacter heliothermus]